MKVIEFEITHAIICITELINLETLFIDSSRIDKEFLSEHIEMKMGNEYWYYSIEQEEENDLIDLFPGYKLTSLKSLTLKKFATCLAKSFCFKNQEERKDNLVSLSLDYRSLGGNSFQGTIYENFSFLKRDFFKKVINLSLYMDSSSSSSSSSSSTEGYKLKESDLFQFTKLEKLELHNLHFKQEQEEQEKSAFSLLKENSISLIHLELVNCNLNLDYLYLCTKIKSLSVPQ